MSTQYRRSPDLYAFNNTTKRHMLKSSVAFKRIFKQTPGIFIDTRIKLLEEVGPIQLPLPPTPEVPSPAVHVGEPLPHPTHPLLTVSDTLDNAMRQQVRALIQAELKQNPNPYTAKSADEMSVLFRSMLIKKLTGAIDTSNKSKPVTKAVVKKSGFKFKLQKPQTSQDEEDEELEDDTDE